MKHEAEHLISEPNTPLLLEEDLFPIGQVPEGFRLEELSAHEVRQGRTRRDVVVFVLEGDAKVRACNYEYRMAKGKILFLHHGAPYRVDIIKDTRAIIFLFDGGAWACRKVGLCDLFPIKQQMQYTGVPLDIRPRMWDFLHNLDAYIQDGEPLLQSLQDLKLHEMFLLFLQYYTKQEVAQFFFMIIGSTPNFSSRVLEVYKECRTVTELAIACNMSLSTFKRKFVQEFGEPASNWLQRHIIGNILQRIADPDVSLSHIAYELNFSSPAHFTRYCKAYLGETPKDLRKRYLSTPPPKKLTKSN